MKLKVVSKSKTEVGTKSLPEQFYEPVRSDLIKRAVLALQSNSRQKYGAMTKAGMRHSADLSKRRRKYRGSYGFGISRVPRKILSRRGTRFNWEGAVIPGTVGGRRAHPPKAEKEWSVKINIKENRKAIRSALAASMVKELVVERGHRPPNDYPFIVGSDFEAIDKTSELTKSLQKLGFTDELARSSETTVRAGKGKLRGRAKKTKKGLLLVIANEEAPVLKACQNILGVEAVVVNNLNAELLAPGTHFGRITLYTDKAIDVLETTKIFTKNYVGPKIEKEIIDNKEMDKLKALKKEKKAASKEKKAAKKKIPKVEKITEVPAQAAVEKTETKETVEKKEKPKTKKKVTKGDEK